MKLLGAYVLGMMSGLHTIVAFNVNHLWPGQPVAHSTAQTVVWAFIGGCYLMLAADLMVSYAKENV